MTCHRDRWRYAAVGLLCAAVHNAIMIAGASLGAHYIVSAAVSYCSVVLLSYALHVGFTFSTTASARSFALYAVSMAANLPLTLILLYVLCGLIKLPMVFASPIATVLLFAWNYLASRWAILSPQRRPKHRGEVA